MFSGLVQACADHLRKGIGMTFRLYKRTFVNIETFLFCPAQIQYLEKDSTSCMHSLSGIRDHIFQIKEELRNDDGEIQVSHTEVFSFLEFLMA